MHIISTSNRRRAWPQCVTGGEEQRNREGDLVIIPAGEKHCHGATAQTAMSHLHIGTPGTAQVVE